MATRVFLGSMALIWLPYGIYCFLVPGSLEQNAGVAAANATGAIEIRAMYGGLQAAIGVLALAALRNVALQRAAVLTMVLLAAGLASTRGIAVLLAGEVSGYTIGALGFEVALFATACWVLGRTPGPAAT
jgi:hypothetical protein